MKEIKFNIEAGYKWGSGWTLQDKEKFDEDLYATLDNYDSWTIIPSTMMAASPSLVKGKTKLYLHPQEFTGPIENEHVDELDKIFKEFVHIEYNGFKIVCENLLDHQELVDDINNNPQKYLKDFELFYAERFSFDFGELPLRTEKLIWEYYVRKNYRTEKERGVKSSSSSIHKALLNAIKSK